MSKQRPTGVTIIAILMAIGGILGILAGLGVLALGATLLGIFTLVVAFVELAIAIGLWSLQPWAYWGAIGVEALSVVLNVFNVLSGNTTISGVLIGVLISLAVIYYLYTNAEVKRAFGR